jgi:hypothetical protein
VSPRVCICCGEPMSQKGNALSRNPNMCASCSSLLDGMEDSPAIVAIPKQDDAPAATNPDERQAAPDDLSIFKSQGSGRES